MRARFFSIFLTMSISITSFRAFIGSKIALLLQHARHLIQVCFPPALLPQTPPKAQRSCAAGARRRQSSSAGCKCACRGWPAAATSTAECAARFVAYAVRRSSSLACRYSFPFMCKLSVLHSSRPWQACISIRYLQKKQGVSADIHCCGTKKAFDLQLC